MGRASVRRERGTDEATVGQASARTASVSLKDGESEPDSFREVRWRDESLRVMRERTVR